MPNTWYNKRVGKLWNESSALLRSKARTTDANREEKVVKTMKRIFIFSAVCCLLCGVFAQACASCFLAPLMYEGDTESEAFARTRIKNLTEIEIPEEAEMVSHYYRSHIREGAIQYSVFQFKNDATDWLKKNAFSEEPNGDFEREFSTSIPHWIGEKIPAEYIPDFQTLYFWHYRQNDDKFFKFFVYFPDTCVLVVYID